MGEIKPRYSGLKHHRAFFAANGEGPWNCASCGEIILKIGRHSREGAVHHINEDKHDNRAENLEIHHFGCHRSLHVTGDKNPAARPEIAAKISAALQRHEVTQATKDAVSRANTGNIYCVGREMSVETRKRISESVQHQRVATCECGKKSRPGSMVSHFKATGHKEVIDV